MELTAYELSSGKIRKRFHGPQEFISINVPDGCSVVLGYYDESLYRVNLSTHQAELKTEIPYVIDKAAIDADGFDEAIISGFPAGTSTVFDGQSQPVPENAIQFFADVPGDYDIVLQHPLYLDTTVTISAQ